MKIKKKVVFKPNNLSTLNVYICKMLRPGKAQKTSSAVETG